MRVLREADAFVDGLYEVRQTVRVGQAVEAAREVVAEVGREEIGEKLDAGLSLLQCCDHFVAALVRFGDVGHEVTYEPFEVGRRSRAAFMHEVLAGNAVAAPGVGVFGGGNVVGDPGFDRPRAHHDVDEALVGEAGANRSRDDVEEAAKDRSAGDEAGFLSRLGRDAGSAFGRADHRRDALLHLVDAEQFEQFRLVGAGIDVIEVAAGDVGDFSAKLAGQFVAHPVVRHQDAVDAIVRIGFVGLEPGEDGDRMTGPDLLEGVGISRLVDVARFPFADDRQRAVVGGDDAVAHGLAVDIDGVQALTVRGEADALNFARCDAAVGDDLANRRADRLPHRPHVALAPADRAGDRGVVQGCDGFLLAVLVVQTALDDGAANIDTYEVSHGRLSSIFKIRILRKKSGRAETKARPQGGLIHRFWEALTPRFPAARASRA